MTKNHLTRLNSPKSWPIKRKTTRFIARPIPGPHPINSCMTLNVLLRDKLGYAKTAKEIKMILNQKNILVDKKTRTNYKFPIGFMDVIEIPSLDERYRVVFNQNGIFSLVLINKEQANLKLLKIIRKNIIKKGLVQLTFHDGRTMALDKFKGSIGDTILFDLTKKTFDKILPMDKSSLVYLKGGSHISKIGKIKDIIKSKDLQKPKIIVEVNGKDHITIMEHVFVIGKDKLELDVEEKK